jgi:hypothetical protein
MTRLNLAVLALLVSALSVSAREAAQPVAVRVHVIAGQPASGNAAATTEGLEDSTTDLREALAKRKGLTIVPTAEDAQVRVEVVDREERDPAQGGFGGTSITKFRQTIVRLRIESGAARSELKGIGQSSWKAAAKDAAERVSKWLESHPPAGETQPRHQ